MSYSFSTPITSGFQIKDHTMWQTLIEAVNERLKAVWNYAGASAKTQHIAAYDRFATTWYTSMTNGVKDQLLTWFRQDGAAYVPVADQVYGLQDAICFMVPGAVTGESPSQFCDHTIYYEGNAAHLFFGDTTTYPIAAWTIPNIRAAAGLPATIVYPIVSSVQNSHWRRKRPREINAITDTADVQGNAAAPGQIAYLVPNVFASPSAPFQYGELYRCHASGDWRRIVAGSPDVLDNTLAAPNAITLYVGGSRGLVQQGDYIGPWLFEEVRQVVNLLRWRWDSTRLFSGTSPDGFSATVVLRTSTGDFQTSGVSNADLLSTLASAWAGTTSAGSGYPSASIWTLLDSGGTLWEGSADRTDATWTVANLGPLTKDVDYLVYAQATASGGSATPAFDAQGDPAGSGGYHIWNTQSAVTGTSSTSPRFGDATAFPAHNPVDPTGPSDVEAKGYDVTDAVAISRFDVAGGFVNLF